MPLSCDHAVDQVRLELARHARCAFHAFADEANASAVKTLDRGDAHVLRQATGDHLALIEGNQENPAHRFSVRVPAATASLELVQRDPAQTNTSAATRSILQRWPRSVTSAGVRLAGIAAATEVRKRLRYGRRFPQETEAVFNKPSTLHDRIG